MEPLQVHQLYDNNTKRKTMSVDTVVGLSVQHTEWLPLSPAKRHFMQNYLQELLKVAGNNISKAARLAGLGQSRARVGSWNNTASVHQGVPQKTTR